MPVLPWTAAASPGATMPAPTPVADVDLRPVPGKAYFSSAREWREEFIYFLMVDRFHDERPRTPPAGTGRTLGVATPDGFYGGKLKGVTNNLAYIAGLWGRIRRKPSSGSDWLRHRPRLWGMAKPAPTVTIWIY